MTRTPSYLWGLITLFLICASLLAPFNHDEDQYYAASYALSHGAIYRDFIYLQTPLNALLGNALMALWPGQSLWLLRISQALLGSAIFALVLTENLRRDVPRRSAILCALLMISCYSFLFATTVYRNDMLPCLLSAMGIVVLTRQTDRFGGDGSPLQSLPFFFFGGLLLALAASAKANFLPLLAAPALWLLLQPRLRASARLKLLLALGAGAVAGALPVILYWSAEPEKFLWQVVYFGAEAPIAWYERVGEGDRLTPLGRAKDAVLILVQGPALAALAMVAFGKLLLRPSLEEGGRERMLDLFILLGLIAALLPNPSWRQYFVVLLPALFMRLPTLLTKLRPPTRTAARNILVLFACVGIAAWSAQAWKTVAHPDRGILTRWAESRWIGTEMRKRSEQGPVASLSPHLVTDSGEDIHLRFVSGVFAYRWGGSGHDREILSMGGVTPANIDLLLAALPPAAIVTGYESGKGNSFSVDLDRPLAAFARRNGYIMSRSPFGKAVLYLRPQLLTVAHHERRGDPLALGGFRRQPARPYLAHYGGLSHKAISRAKLGR